MMSSFAESAEPGVGESELRLVVIYLTQVATTGCGRDARNLAPASPWNARGGLVSMT